MENNKPEDRVETVGDIKYKITYVPCTCPCHSSGGTMKHFMPCCQDGYTKTSTEIKEEKKGISISPGAFSGINAPSPWDAYRTKENGEKAMPFEILLGRLKHDFECNMLDCRRFEESESNAEIKYCIDSFLALMADEYNLWEDEKKLLKIDISYKKLLKIDISYKEGMSIDGGLIIGMEPTNMFTACVLFGKYVPKFFIAPDSKEVITRDLSKVTYKDDKYYLSEVDETKIKSTDELRMMSVSEHEKYYNNIPYKNTVIALSFPASKEITHSIEEKKINDFEKENPGVPYGATELSPGKNYSGRSDGNYEIKTINGRLWFIPGACCDFDEDM